MARHTAGCFPVKTDNGQPSPRMNYFAIGHSGRCFSYVRDWVEMKMRRHLLRNQQRRGFGWQRRRRAWLFGTLGLFGDYRVRYYAAPTGVSAR
jgi:RNA-directed DNA polymerase